MFPDASDPSPWSYNKPLGWGSSLCCSLLACVVYLLGLRGSNHQTLTWKGLEFYHWNFLLEVFWLPKRWCQNRFFCSKVSHILRFSIVEVGWSDWFCTTLRHACLIKNHDGTPWVRGLDRIFIFAFGFLRLFALWRYRRNFAPNALEAECGNQSRCTRACWTCISKAIRIVHVLHAPALAHLGLPLGALCAQQHLLSGRSEHVTGQTVCAWHVRAVSTMRVRQAQVHLPRLP